MLVDRAVAPFYDITLTLGQRIMCEFCGQVPAQTSQSARPSDEQLYDRAVDMHRHGWHIVGRLEVLCPKCAANLRWVA